MYDIEKLNVANGEIIQPLNNYGVGIDCHSKFIQICILVKHGDEIRQYEESYSTSWIDLSHAKDWIIKTIREKSLPTINLESFTYTIESTSTYHLPIIKALGGNPCVVNPVLAGHTRRKTDVLDARLLAYQNMTGLWPPSFIITPQIQQLRLLMKERLNALRYATSITNRINNYILRFGHTVGALRSVRTIENRAAIEDMCSDNFDYELIIQTNTGEYICPEGLPDVTKIIIMEMYEKYDRAVDAVKYYEKKALNYAKSLEWETAGGWLVKGEELIKNLLTVPGVGEIMVLTWLTEIVTPLRFPSHKHLAAYCGCDPSLKVSAGKTTSHTRRKGNSTLHDQLIRCAGTCINRANEPFGQWGKQIYSRHVKGGYKKASGAVARRICIAMYYIHLNNIPFSYDGYNFFRIEVNEVAIEEMGLSNRLTSILTNTHEFKSSKEVTESYIKGEFKNKKGIGQKSVTEIKTWIEQNKKSYKNDKINKNNKNNKNKGEETNG